MVAAHATAVLVTALLLSHADALLSYLRAAAAIRCQATFSGHQSTHV